MNPFNMEPDNDEIIMRVQVDPKKMDALTLSLNRARAAMQECQDAIQDLRAAASALEFQARRIKAEEENDEA